MAAKKELLILAEYSQNKIHPVVFELLNKGQKLAEKADLNLSVLLLLPKKIDFSELIAHGADKVYYMEDPVFANPDEFIYKENILSFLAKAQIEIVLTGATNFGRSLAPRIAAGLKTGLTADCTALDIDEAGNLIQIRPAFSENILAHIKSDSRPQMATIRYQEFKKGTADRSRQGEIIALETKIKDNPNLKDIKKHIVKADNNTIKLTPKEFELLAFLAQNQNQVFKRTQLLNKIWGFNNYSETRTVDEHVKRIRKKLKEAGLNTIPIETVWGVGYKFSRGVENNENE